MLSPVSGFPNYAISNDGIIYSQKGEIKHAIHKNGYHLGGLSNGKRQYFLVHRLVYKHFGKDFDPTLTVDHINGNKSDNRIENLRMATPQQQQFNKISHNKTGFKGVSKVGNRYQAQIQIDGKKTYLGLFKTIEEAKEVYDTKAKELHGEFYRG
jgi:hypothetical protein